ncbi:hypothetical protein SB758_38885, partial [Burkholderia sp. SIMBA_013]
TARMACVPSCTTCSFSKKTQVKPVGGRGISGFIRIFFDQNLFSSDASSRTLDGPLTGWKH